VQPLFQILFMKKLERPILPDDHRQGADDRVGRGPPWRRRRIHNAGKRPRMRIRDGGVLARRDLDLEDRVRHHGIQSRNEPGRSLPERGQERADRRRHDPAIHSPVVHAAHGRFGCIRERAIEVHGASS
jgi:hypothetical protein